MYSCRLISSIALRANRCKPKEQRPPRHSKQEEARHQAINQQAKYPWQTFSTPQGNSCPIAYKNACLFLKIVEIKKAVCDIKQALILCEGSMVYSEPQGQMVIKKSSQFSICSSKRGARVTPARDLQLSERQLRNVRGLVRVSSASEESKNSQSQSIIHFSSLCLTLYPLGKAAATSAAQLWLFDLSLQIAVIPPSDSVLATFLQLSEVCQERPEKANVLPLKSSSMTPDLIGDRLTQTRAS